MPEAIFQDSPDSDQIALISELNDVHQSNEMEFSVINDEKAGIYEAVAGGTEIGGLPYNLVGRNRVILLGTSVFPAYRRRGVATGLIRSVLTDLRQQGKTVTIMCPVVRAFIDRNPEYADLIDAEHPGTSNTPHGS